MRAKIHCIFEPSRLHRVSTTRTTVATWNVEWATTRGRRGATVRDRLARLTADILVVTEGRRGLLPDDGYTLDGGDWGYAIEPDRRKVLAYSRQPFSDVIRIESGGGAGRVVTALTDTPIGAVRLLAVCIPWSRAHVSTGRRDAAPWSEHLACLDQIEDLVNGFEASVPVIVAGDFNQKIPRARQPILVADRLAEVMTRWTCHTAGTTDDGQLIDHIASNVDCVALRTWPGTTGDLRLSDHSGVVCELAQT
ncbi:MULTISPECIES: endonuclease/exonuclease/phosphatase family protein [unclassified Rhodococcus (in: high G+C Gram-positive bacteria)]|uniref:endonuclease/exonuclease/phosphatase family protein n=1 Tax=unclassified Rhodococcus (in: high G+C Gram-positive bacteria) TaxID=192944 RepID=UPI0027DEEE49|nr:MULTISPECIES: endonuclease/exonuclease/phosphatase family protein [unclassified Rhodococcus (in: high G+C Gram-positive bacteria)]